MEVVLGVLLHFVITLPKLHLLLDSYSILLGKRSIITIFALYCEDLQSSNVEN